MGLVPTCLVLDKLCAFGPVEYFCDGVRCKDWVCGPSVGQHWPMGRDGGLVGRLELCRLSSF